MKISLWFWWIYASRHPSKIYKCKVLARIIYGESCLKVDTSRYNAVHNKSCSWCPGPVVETAAHLLFECERFDEFRQRKWQAVTDSMPHAMVDCVGSLNASDKLKFILSGFNGCKYEQEWENIFEAVIDFIYEIYKQRRMISSDE